MNITIDESLLNAAKQYAEQHQTSLSRLVETYLKNLTKKPARENIITLVEKLEPTKTDPGTDLKDQYYKDKKANYGF